MRIGPLINNSKHAIGSLENNIVYLWSIDVSNKQLSLMTGISLRTIATTLAKIRQSGSLKILHGNIKLGGRRKTVEFDESMFGHKRKYNRGRVSEGAWVFGMVQRGSDRALTFRVPDRTRETLVTRLLQEFIQPGTMILSDKFNNNNNI